MVRVSRFAKWSVGRAAIGYLEDVGDRRRESQISMMIIMDLGDEGVNGIAGLGKKPRHGIGHCFPGRCSGGA